LQLFRAPGIFICLMEHLSPDALLSKRQQPLAETAALQIVADPKKNGTKQL